MKSPVGFRTLFTTIVPILLIVGFVVGGIAMMQALRKPPEAAQVEPKGLAVFVAEATPTNVTLSVTTQGEARPRREIDVVPQVGGKLVYVSPAFIEGGFFEEGDVLLRIDPADYRLSLTRSSAEVARAQRALDREIAEAEIAARDWEELGEGEASSLTLREPQLAEARASLAAARATLQDAQLQLDRTEIKAPFDGRVREKSADTGQFVSPGSSLGRIFATDVIQVRLPLTDDELSILNLPVAYLATEDDPGAPVVLKGAVGGEERSWEGAITRTDSAIDTRTRTLFAFAEVQDPYGAAAEEAGAPLPVGLFVTAEITGRTIADAISLPRSALRGSDQSFVANQDGTLSIRTVKVAYSDRDRVVLTSGVEAGEFVVTSSILSPQSGMKIEAFDPSGVLLFPKPEEAEDETDGDESDTEAAVAAAEANDGENL